MEKIYLVTTLFTAMVLLMGVGSFNWAVDPFMLFGARDILGFSPVKGTFPQHQRMIKAHAVRHNPVRAVILGSSRAQVGLSTDHPGWKATPVYNLALGGSNIYQTLRYLQHTLAVTDIQQVVIGLDFRSFNGLSPNLHGDYREERLAVDVSNRPQWAWSVPLDILKALFTWDGTSASIDILRGPPPYFIDSSGREFFPKFKEPQRGKFQQKERGHMTNGGWFPEPTHCCFQFHNPETGVSMLDLFRRIVRLAYEHNVDTRLLISPIHARLLLSLEQSGLWSQYEQWQRALVSIVTEEAQRVGRTPFPLWDFSGFNSITTEEVPPITDSTTRMKYYYEASHYSPATGDLILDRVFEYQQPDRSKHDDFGVLLTARNIDSHLAELLAAMSEYKRSHPEDFLEVQQLAEEAREWRTSQSGLAITQ